MQILPIKTRLVETGQISIADLLEESIKTLPEKSIVAVSSKIVALCEGSVVDKSSISKLELVQAEADFYTKLSFSPYHRKFAVFGNNFLTSAGIDESNAGNKFILSPRRPSETAEHIRQFLCQKFSRRLIGTIITDSTGMTPMRRGTSGVALGWSGFKALKSLVGQPDLFGHPFQYEVQSILGGLADAANLVMGEATEKTPLAIISDIDFVQFTERAPTEAEIEDVFVPFNRDLFYAFFRLAPWQRGGGGYRNRSKK
jgi:F420-0:gamma-glutamyl ligase